ncbi:MAG: SWIM zinc finger family protein, partial [Deltaproteobacteria bacterium]|nr:SWIM zinc finger family protein [Kofleriaceae bacterium]
MIRDASRRGKPLAPIVIEGKKIATTFWGKAWCDNIERYRDFAYRLERGRSYVRSGSVIDLAITPGRVKAKVLGSELYDVAVELAAVTPASWRAIQRDCAGSIGSLVDLLAGTLSEAVMARLCAERTGLFPTPAEIAIDCSCPDYASMCKHVAAVMYGVGARLDRAPDLLFTLRKVSADELVASVAADAPRARRAPKSARVLTTDDGGLSALFGIDLADGG